MIRLRDATMLALTKLRTRKVRLIVTIVVSGLLFSALAGASLVARGIMGGVSGFSKEGLGDRYIVQAYPQINYSFSENSEVIERALAIHKDTVARKKTEAKRLGIPYNADNDPAPQQEFDTPGGKKRFLNSEHPASKQAIQEYLVAHPQPDKQLFGKTAEPYKPIGLYSSKMLPYDQQGGQLQVLKDGKENYNALGFFGEGQNGPPTGTDSFISSWSVMSSELLLPFILPGQNLATGPDGSIPIIVPRSAAEQLLGLKALPASAPAADRLERTKAIRTSASDIRFSVCQRNAASASLVQLAVSTKQEMDKNKDKKDYQKPELIYGLPTEACGSVPVTRDVRTKEAKTLAAKQLQFDQLFGAEPAAQSTLTFRIVGIVPDIEWGGAFGVAEVIRSLVTSSLGSGWYSPYEQVGTNPLMGALFNRTSIFTNETFYAEFGSADQAREFIDKESCTPDYNKDGSQTDVVAQCQEKGQAPFTVVPYGSNSLALESAKRTFGKVFGIAALIVSGIACIIMMGTVGRMIADSRRETAVFRAIGAKKLDIAQIYTIYVICLSLLISVFALGVGLLLALLAHNRWSAEATIQAITAYNSQDLDKTFPLYAFYIPDILILIGLALAAGVLSAALPLFRNLRRNPIRDMRDDT